MQKRAACAVSLALFIPSPALAVKAVNIAAPPMGAGLGVPISIAPPAVSLTPLAADLGGPALIPLSPSLLTGPAPAAIGPAPAPLAPSALKATPAAAKSDGPEPAEAAVPAAAVEPVSTEERALAKTQLADIAAALEDETPGLALEKAFDNDPAKLKKAIKVILNRADLEKAGRDAAVVRALEYARTYLHRNPRADETRKMVLDAKLRRSLLTSVEHEPSLAPRFIRAFAKKQSSIYSIFPSPDGGLLFVSEFEGVRMLDTATGDVIGFFEGSGIVSSVLSPDGRHLFTGGINGTVRMWSVETKQEIRKFIGAHTDWIRAITLSADGRRLFTGSDDHTAAMWDVDAGEKLRTFKGHTEYIYSIALSPDGRRLFTGSRDKTARMWDVATGQETRIFDGHTDEVRSIALSPDGRRLFTGSHDATARMWDVANGKELERFNADLIESVALSPNGRHLFTGGYDKKTRMWHIGTGRLTSTSDGHAASVQHIALRGRRLFTAGADSARMSDFPKDAATPILLAAEALYEDLRSLVSDIAAEGHRSTRRYRALLAGVLVGGVALNPSVLIAAPVLIAARYFLAWHDLSFYPDLKAYLAVPDSKNKAYLALHKRQLKLQNKTAALAKGFEGSDEAPKLLAADEEFEHGITKLLEHPRKDIRGQAAHILAEAVIAAAVSARESGLAPEAAAYYASLLDADPGRSPVLIQQSVDDALKRRGFEDNREFLQDFDALRQSHHE